MSLIDNNKEYSDAIASIMRSTMDDVDGGSTKPHRFADIRPELVLFHSPDDRSRVFFWPSLDDIRTPAADGTFDCSSTTSDELSSSGSETSLDADVIPDVPLFDYVKQVIHDSKQVQPDRPVKVYFLVHGYFRNNSVPWMTEMKDELLRDDRTSLVFLLGWGNKYGYGAKSVFYSKAVANTQSVGEWLGRIVRTIREDHPGIYVHGIGHSLGAHLLGFAGRTSRAFDRITGLDPAGPKYDDDDDQPLTTDDALDFVDVIHTDGKTFGFGTLKPMGTIDFYPNNGKHQPGRVGLTKSHSRAHDLFTWSIANPGAFRTSVALYPESTVDDPVWVQDQRPEEMGFHCRCTRKPGGCYYIKTRGHPPWIR